MVSLSLKYVAFLVIAFSHAVWSIAPSDTWRDADVGGSSYLGGAHNIDPAVVDSPEFGELWSLSLNVSEKFFAKPLVYTPSESNRQVVFLASTANVIRTIDAETGEIVNVRSLAEPYPAGEVYCTDIADTIGIIGTPTIDPETDIAYFYAKSFIPNLRMNKTTGILNSVYYFYAVDVNTLQDVEGFPMLIDNVPADNDPRRYFLGGLILQRPPLLRLGSVVYAAFGGLCDQFNYTGTILGVDVKTKKLVTNFVTQAGPSSSFTSDWTYWHGGGPGGIWQGGLGLTTDGENMYFVTDNGYNEPNNTKPLQGKTELLTLTETAVRIRISDDKRLHVVDFFRPYDYQGDQGLDIGSGGIVLLDSDVFHGSGVERVAVVGSSYGKVYVLNADNLGGFKQGPDETDLVLQTLLVKGSMFGGVGSYPLDGGYIYAAPQAQPVSAFKLGFDDDGNFNFTLVGKSKEIALDRAGIGIPTVTSFQEQPGSGIVWLTDPVAGLRAWHALPADDGTLKSIPLPQINGTFKFQRPVFGDGKVYVVDSGSVLHCLG